MSVLRPVIEVTKSVSAGIQLLDAMVFDLHGFSPLEQRWWTEGFHMEPPCHCEGTVRDHAKYGCPPVFEYEGVQVWYDRGLFFSNDHLGGEEWLNIVMDCLQFIHGQRPPQAS